MKSLGRQVYVCKQYLLWGLKHVNRTYFEICGASADLCVSPLVLGFPTSGLPLTARLPLNPKILTSKYLQDYMTLERVFGGPHMSSSLKASGRTLKCLGFLTWFL